MKKLAAYLIFLSLSCNAQTLQPYVFNSSGATATVGSVQGPVTVYYNIGEPLYNDIQSTSAQYRLTQGFLQPETIGSSVLSVYTYTSPMSCFSSNDASILLNAAGANAPFHYRWFKNGMQLPDTGSSLLNLAVGTYSFAVTDAKGNTVGYSRYMPDGSGPCKIIIHNGLTPNHDGKNDFFYIEHIGDYDNNVSIYNRWGNLIWAAKGYDNQNVSWKGEDGRGYEVPPGTYYFLIEIEGKKTTGWVELMR
jgi:gliding motility-associated-like protein